MYADHLVIQWRRKILFINKPDREIAFDTISLYHNAGSYFTIKLFDGTKYDLCNKLFIFGKSNSLSQFAEDFIISYRQYKSGAGSPQQVSMAEHLVTSTTDTDNFDEEVVSRRSAVFYFSVIFGIIFLGAMGAGMIIVAVDEKNVFMALFGVVIFLVIYYFISRYYRNAPVVKASGEGISFNKRFYRWDQVQAVELTGSQPFNIMGGYNMEGAKIEFTDGETRYLFDGMYANLWKVRTFIQHTVPGKITPATQEESLRSHSATSEIPVTNIPVNPAYTPGKNDVHYVKGNPYTNFSAILMWLMVAFFIGCAVYSADADFTISEALLVFAIGFYFLFTLGINHFGLSSQYIIVRNVYRPWSKKMFLLADIREVVLASNQHGDNTLRLILHDFRTKEYAGKGLLNHDWIEIMNLLKTYNVPVKDENDFVAWSKPEMKKVKRGMIWYVILYFVVCIASYMAVVQMKVSDNAMIILKIGWFLFIILALIGMMFLIVRLGSKEKKGSKD